MILTQQQRDLFAAWLEREASSAEAIAKPMEQLPGLVGAHLAKQELDYAAAARLIADRLRKTHSETVG